MATSSSRQAGRHFHRSFSTIKTFEEPEVVFLGENSENNSGPATAGISEIVKINQGMPANFLLVALLDHLSSLYVEDPSRRKQLFIVLVNELMQHNIFPNIGSLDEISSLRAHYKKAFEALVKAAINSISDLGVHPGKPKNLQERVQIFIQPRLLKQPLSSWVDELCIQTSRYQEEFTQVGMIDSGGYGSVYRAENKLDGCKYAIKKIAFSSTNSHVWSQIMREVKLLAQLSHKHVVRYHNAWMEYVPTSLFLRRSTSLQDFPEKSGSDAGEYIVASNNNSLPLPALTYLSSSSPHQSDEYSNENVANENDSNVSIEFRDASHSTNGLSRGGRVHVPSHIADPSIHAPWSASSYKPTHIVVLHIQMELCASDLKVWLEARNNGLTTGQHSDCYEVVNEEDNLHLLKCLLKAVDHIHEQGFIHRDIKPTNIFLSDHNVLKLGDFGLARHCCSPMTPDPGHTTAFSEATYTSGLGTKLYAAPEQLTKSDYNEKCDMYSVGIVIFELYHPFATSMERADCLTQLREHQTLPSSFVIRWPKQAKYILQLLHMDACLRPSARDILQSELFFTKDQVISELRAENEQQRRTISQMTELCAEKDKEIERLKLQLKHTLRV